jgi:predicted SAM-dependent methyltransferase
MTNKIKLHLACGNDYQEGYINVDLYPKPDAKVDAQYDVTRLPYENETVDEIRALHIIEHFDFNEGVEVLKEWRRVLKPGGKIILETPDFLESCRAFVNSTEEQRCNLYGHFFSQASLDPGQTHKFLYTESQLYTSLHWAGFSMFNRISPLSNYVSGRDPAIFLAVEATK